MLKAYHIDSKGLDDIYLYIVMEYLGDGSKNDIISHVNIAD